MIIPFGNIVPALIAAGAAIASGVGALIANHKTNKANKKIARDSNQQQIDYNWQMWHAQNEYNNPAAQRQRLNNAGLNPIYYGLDGNSAGSGNAFTPATPQMAQPSLQNFAELSNIAMQYYQAKNLEADTRLKDAETGLTEQQALSEQLLRAGRIDLLGSQIKVADAEALLKGAQRMETLKSIDAMQQSMQESQQRIESAKAQMSKWEFEKRIQQCIYELDKKYKEGLLDYNTKMLAIHMFDSQTRRFEASTQYYNAETNYSAMLNNAYYHNQMLPYQQGFYKSLTEFNKVKSRSVSDANWRANELFKFDKIIQCVNAYKSVVDMFFYPSEKNSKIIGNLIGGLGSF